MTTTNREKHYANWGGYVVSFQLEHNLLNTDYTQRQHILSGFAARTKSGLYGNRQQFQA